MRRSVDARDVKMQTVTSNGYSPRDMHIGNVRVMWPKGSSVRLLAISKTGRIL